MTFFLAYLFGCSTGAQPTTPATAVPDVDPIVTGRAPAGLHTGPWIVRSYEAKNLQAEAAEVAISLTDSARLWVTDDALELADGDERRLFASLRWDGARTATIPSAAGRRDGKLLVRSPSDVEVDTGGGVLRLQLVPYEASLVTQRICWLADAGGRPGHVARRPRCEPDERTIDPL
jgi:hypothetical protein